MWAAADSRPASNGSRVHLCLAMFGHVSPLFGNCLDTCSPTFGNCLGTCHLCLAMFRHVSPFCIGFVWIPTCELNSRNEMITLRRFNSRNVLGPLIQIVFEHVQHQRPSLAMRSRPQTYLLPCILTCLLTYSHAPLYSYLLTPIHTCLLYSYLLLLTYSLTHLLTHLLTYLLTYLCSLNMSCHFEFGPV